MDESRLRRRISRDLLNAAMLEMRGDYRLAMAARARALRGRFQLVLLRVA